MEQRYRWVVVDAMDVVHRYGWGQEEQRTRRGIPNGVERGFLDRILGLARDYTPARLVVAWDGTSQRLLSIDPTYKAKRRAEAQVEVDLPARVQALRNCLSHYCLTLYREDAEADEEIARFVDSLDRRDGVLVVSADRDFHQLVRPSLNVLDRDRALRDVDYVCGYWGVREPFQVTLVRSAEGDGSDDIKGIGRVRKAGIRAVAADSVGIESFLTNLILSPELSEGERIKTVEARNRVRRNFRLMDLLGLGGQWTPYGDEATDGTAVFDLCGRLELHEIARSKVWSLLRTFVR